MKFNVKNNHDALLNVAGEDIRPGATVAIEQKALESWAHGNAAKIWIEQKLVEVTGRDGDKLREDDDEGGDKPDRAALLAKAKELGLTLPGNISNAKLAEAVADAEADKA